MRPKSFQETGDTRILCKLRIKPLTRLQMWARMDGDLTAYKHYESLAWKEFNDWQQGKGIYAYDASLSE